VKQSRRSPWLMSLLTIVSPPCYVYYAAISLAQYPLPNLFSPGHDVEETSPWTSPRLTSY
jgi:hypothetical protein